MRGARASVWVGVAGVGCLVVIAACHHAPSTAAPLPAPQGTPPQVQTPVGAAPIEEATAVPTVSSPDPQLRRFAVVTTEDTTFTILIGADHWVRRGTVGVTVDPKRRDALVAKFRILSRTGDSAIALVTGQTTRVSPTDVALIREPVPSPLRQGVFWGGLFLGIGVGVGAALLARH